MRWPIFLLALGACGSESDEDEQEETPDPVTVVEVAQVQLGEVADTITASGIVESERAAAIVPAATGIVIRLAADVGDRVERGQLLAVLDNVSLDAGDQRARDEVRRLETQVDEMTALAARGAVSSRELEDVKYQLRSARTSAREASRSLGQTRLTAPFAGVVSERNVRIGELTGTSGAAFSVVDLETLRVVVALPERDLSRAQLGQTARLVSAYDDEVWTHATVQRLAPVVNPASGTFEVVLGLTAGDTILRPGQFVSAELEVDRRAKVVAIRKSAVVYEDGTPVAYTMVDAPAEDDEQDDEESAEASWWSGIAAVFSGGSDDAEDEAAAEEDDGPRLVARRVPVRVGLSDERHVEVLEGLDVGDQLVVIGQSHLRDGAAIRTVEQARAAAERAEKAKKDADPALESADAEEDAG
jgi:membrane fusion protein, multidrug efflux system